MFNRDKKGGKNRRYFLNIFFNKNSIEKVKNEE